MTDISETNEKRPLCRKCFLEELDFDGTYQTVLEYISALDPELKASDEEYSSRLKVCAGCDKLSFGTCESCGCFVELRAAKKKQSCPNKKW